MRGRKGVDGQPQVTSDMPLASGQAAHQLATSTCTSASQSFSSCSELAMRWRSGKMAMPPSNLARKGEPLLSILLAKITSSQCNLYHQQRASCGKEPNLIFEDCLAMYTTRGT